MQSRTASYQRSAPKSPAECSQTIGADGIEFKKKDEPEFAIFFDAYPSCRDDMALLPGMISAIQQINQGVFEFNFPIDACHNRYRICYWRRSMGNCVNSDVHDLSRMFKEMLQVFFDSQFYKLTRDAEYQGQ